MIDNFKFFSDNDETEIPVEFVNLSERNTASWMWELYTQLSNSTYTLQVVECNGIIEFLELFHPQQIVIVRAIIGPNNLAHIGNSNNGWGFNIQTDPLTIVYLSYDAQ